MNNELWELVRDRFEALERMVEGVRAEVKGLRADLNNHVRRNERNAARRQGWLDMLKVEWAIVGALLAVAGAVVALGLWG